jgi:hypothetical protein
MPSASASRRSSPFTIGEPTPSARRWRAALLIANIAKIAKIANIGKSSGQGVALGFGLVSSQRERETRPVSKPSGSAR